MCRVLLYSALCALLAIALPGRAAESDLQYDGFQLFVENDKYSGFKKTDQWYTNGVRLVVLPKEPPFDPLKRYAAWVGNEFGDGQPARFGFTLGQDIYTPKDISNAEPQPYDRPWAGWLYLGALGQINNARKQTQSTVEVSMGVVGPASGASRAQTFVHDLIGAQKPAGWGNQLKNELGVVVSYRHKRRWVPAFGREGGEGDGGEVHFDVIPQWGVSLGNVFTNAAVGGMVRWGQNLSGFGDDRFTNTVESSPDRRPYTVSTRFGIREWYVFARGEARAVGRNIFLDGNTVRDSASVDKRYLVGDFSLGASIRFSGGLRMTYAHNRRTSEFKPVDERTPNGTPRFGTLVLAYEF